MAFEVREIPLGQLRPAEWNGNRVPPNVLAKVRRSIDEFGVVENLVARPHPEEAGAYEVISGATTASVSTARWAGVGARADRRA